MGKKLYMENISKDDLSVLGSDYLADCSYNLGINILNRAIEQKSEQAAITLASFYISWGNFFAAIKILNQGLTYAVNKAEFYLLLAHCYNNLNEQNLSEYYCGELFYEKQGKPFVLTIPDSVDFENDNFDNYNDFKILPKKEERDTDNKIEEASLLYEKGNYESCLKILKGIKGNYKESKRNNLKLMCYLLTDQNDKAYNYAKKFYETHNKKDLNSLGFLVCLAKDKKEKDKYIKDLINYKVKEDDDYYRLATIAYECQLYDLSLYNFEEAISQEGPDAELCVSAAVSAAGAKKYYLALQYAELSKFLDDKSEFLSAVLMKKIKKLQNGEKPVFPVLAFLEESEMQFYKNNLLFILESGNFSGKDFKNGSFKRKQLYWLLNNYPSEDLLIIATLAEKLNLLELLDLFNERLLAYEIEEEQKIYIIANYIIKNETFSCYFFSKEAKLKKLEYSPLPQNIINVGFCISLAILIVMGADFQELKNCTLKINNFVSLNQIDKKYAGLLLIMKYAKRSLVEKYCNEFMLDIDKASQYFEILNKSCN